MGLDKVNGIPTGYDCMFGCWGSTQARFHQGDEVPPVGIAKTYSVQLTGDKRPPKFLIVRNLKIEVLAAPDPATGYPVFDNLGGYLGHGSLMVKRAAESTPQTQPESMTQTGVWTVRHHDSTPTQTRDEKREKREKREKTETFSHTLRLRSDFMVKLKLPTNLTKSEAQRLFLWVQAIQSGDGD